MAGAGLDHEEHVQTPQGHRAVDVEEIARQHGRRPGCAGTAARSCGCAAARAGSAAASAPAAPWMPRPGSRGRAARPGSACNPSPGSPVPSARSAPRAWRRLAVGLPWRIGPPPADQPPMPAQQSAWCHQPAHPHRPGEQPCQGGEYRPICPVQLRPGVLTPQHGDLVAQHQQFGVLRRRRACQQRHPAPVRRVRHRGGEHTRDLAELDRRGATSVQRGIPRAPALANGSPAHHGIRGHDGTSHGLTAIQRGRIAEVNRRACCSPSTHYRCNRPSPPRMTLAD